jgi:hypothetical protein
LLNGIDDPSDPLLGYEISGGYRSFPPHKEGKYKEDNGTFWGWGMNRRIIKRFMEPEIPGKISKNKKKAVVEIFFHRIIIPITREII